MIYTTYLRNTKCLNKLKYVFIDLIVKLEFFFFVTSEHILFVHINISITCRIGCC